MTPIAIPDRIRAALKLIAVDKKETERSRSDSDSQIQRAKL